MARSDNEARAALCDAVAAMVRALPGVLHLPAVDRLEIVNPRHGFALRESRLRPITQDFGAEAARLLYGERAELATLVVNGHHRLSLDLDARSFVTGHLSISLGAPSPAGVIAELKRAYEGDFDGVIADFEDF